MSTAHISYDCQTYTLAEFEGILAMARQAGMTGEATMRVLTKWDVARDGQRVRRVTFVEGTD